MAPSRQTLAPPDNILYAATVVSSCEVWAGGVSGWTGATATQGNALIEHWTGGSSWSVTQVPGAGPDSAVEGMSAVSPSDVWGVGRSGGHALTDHWNGSSWSQSLIPSVGTELYAVSADSATDAWAAGYGTDSASGDHSVVLHWDGKSWAASSLPSPVSQGRLLGISAAGPSDVWAAGFDAVAAESGRREPLLLHWDGSAWTQSPAPAGFGLLSAVATVSASDAWAVGTVRGGNAGIMHWDGSAWAQVPLPAAVAGAASSALGGVAARSADDVWAVGGTDPGGAGTRPLVLHWDGSALAQLTVPGGPDSAVRGVAPAGSGSAWVSGGNSTSGTALAEPVPVVPSVVGAAVPSAQVQMEAAGFVVGQVTMSQQCGASGGGLILSSSPAAGTQSSFHTQVQLTECNPNVTVPNVLGMADSNARGLITGSALAVGSVSLDNRCLDVAGAVLAQDPAAGATANRGSAVNLTESSGKKANGKPCTIS